MEKSKHGKYRKKFDKEYKRMLKEMTVSVGDHTVCDFGEDLPKFWTNTGMVSSARNFFGGKKISRNQR